MRSALAHGSLASPPAGQKGDSSSAVPATPGQQDDDACREMGFSSARVRSEGLPRAELTKRSAQSPGVLWEARHSQAMKLGGKRRAASRALAGQA